MSGLHAYYDPHLPVQTEQNVISLHPVDGCFVYFRCCLFIAYHSNHSKNLPNDLSTSYRQSAIYLSKIESDASSQTGCPGGERSGWRSRVFRRLGGGVSNGAGVANVSTHSPATLHTNPIRSSLIGLRAAAG